MNLSKAVSLSLGEVQEPVVTHYRLGLIVHQLYLEKMFQGERLSYLTKGHATATEFNEVVRQLNDAGILRSHPNFPGKVYRLLGQKDSDINEVACTIDPFCYVSHLSAMAHHGITNRMPVKLFISGPDPIQWKVEALKQMERDLGDSMQTYVEGGMPQLTRPKLQRIDRVEIHRYSSLHWGAFINVRGKSLRVSTIGRTFLDMLRSPNLCGGMNHVIEVWEEQAQTYLNAIVGEIDQHGGPIDKVRAGYLLDERIKIKNPTVEDWTKYAKRGGSRKMDPSAEYMPHWSEKWCLSLNI